MKKLILSLLAAVALTTANAGTITLTTVVQTSGLTNLLANLAPTNGPIKILQVLVSNAGSTTNSVQLIDMPFGQLQYTNAAYTNTSYAYSNSVALATYTNYYGVVTVLTNTFLVELTNNLVIASTNNYPTRLALTASAGSTIATPMGSAYYSFIYGLWATNVPVSGGTTPLSVTIVGER